MTLAAIALLASFTDALWIGENLPDGVKAVSEKNCPVFRRTFELEAAPADAKVTVTGLGFFEVYVNGRKAGDEVLTPAACDWTHRCYYYVWDVTQLLGKGVNEIRGRKARSHTRASTWANGMMPALTAGTGSR